MYVRKCSICITLLKIAHTILFEVLIFECPLSLNLSNFCPNSTPHNFLAQEVLFDIMSDLGLYVGGLFA